MRLFSSMIWNSKAKKIPQRKLFSAGYWLFKISYL